MSLSPSPDEISGRQTSSLEKFRDDVILVTENLNDLRGDCVDCDQSQLYVILNLHKSVDQLSAKVLLAPVRATLTVCERCSSSS